MPTDSFENWVHLTSVEVETKLEGEENPWKEKGRKLVNLIRYLL